jgi:hypothetical protein
LTICYEVWFMTTDPLVAGRKEILLNFRVLSEFGDNVNIPFVLGWNLNGSSRFFAYVKGKQAKGFVFADMVSLNGKQTFLDLESP